MEASSAAGVPVSVHGVNYTADSFRYVVVDPRDESNRAGGEHIEPFAGSGIMCCYTLPKRWVPGITVNVRSTHSFVEGPERTLREVESVYTVEVPRYPEGNVADLWVVRTADGGIELVSSNVEPTHPEWPGRIKGWPVPSIEYQRKRWELYRELAEDNVKLYRKSLDDLKTKSRQHLQENWEHDKQYNPDIVKKFSGPDDRSYAEHQRLSYLEGLARSQAKLAELLKEKP
jgi:hypothetical protein